MNAKAIAKLEAECREYRRKELEAMSDEALLELLFEDMFYDELFRRYAPDMQSWLFRENDAESAMQAFAELWFQIKVTKGEFLANRTKGANSLAPYLFSLAQSLANQLQAA